MEFVMDSSFIDKLLGKLDTIADVQKQICKRLDQMEDKIAAVTSGMAQLTDELADVKQEIGTVNEQSWMSLELSNQPIAEDKWRVWAENLDRRFRSAKSVEEQEKMGTKETIKGISVILKKFAGDRRIEEECCNLIEKFAGCSKVTRKRVVESGCLDVVINMFGKYWPHRNEKENLFREIFPLLTHISDDLDSGKSIVGSKLIELFFSPLSGEQFTEFTLLSCAPLSKFLDISDADWKFTRAKEEIDEKIIASLEKDDLRKVKNMVNDDAFMSYVKKLENGTKGQAHHAVWCIAHLTTGSPTYYRTSREPMAAIPALEKLVADPTYNSKTIELAQVALEILRN